MDPKYIFLQSLNCRITCQTRFRQDFNHFYTSSSVCSPHCMCVFSSWSSQSVWSCYPSIWTVCWRVMCCCRELMSRWTTGLTWGSWSAAWTSQRPKSFSTPACCHWWDDTHGSSEVYCHLMVRSLKRVKTSHFRDVTLESDYGSFSGLSPFQNPDAL